MPDEPLQPARQATPVPTVEESIRGSAWMVAQQAAQMVGEVGVGVGGIAGAVQVAKGLRGTSKGEQSAPAQDDTQSGGSK